MKHIQRIHEGVRYPCNQCEYSAAQPGNLKIHIQSIHEGEKNGVRYPCCQCKYRATSRGNPKIHI